jgi:hypothetical protein
VNPPTRFCSFRNSFCRRALLRVVPQLVAPHRRGLRREAAAAEGGGVGADGAVEGAHGAGLAGGGAGDAAVRIQVRRKHQERQGKFSLIEFTQNFPIGLGYLLG